MAAVVAPADRILESGYLFRVDLLYLLFGNTICYPSPISTIEATELLQKLSLESQGKPKEVSEATKKIPSSDRSTTPVLQEFMDPNMCYLPNGYASSYYYGSYEVPISEWEDYPRYVHPDGVDMPPPGVYGDMYHPGYAYPSYSPYPPAGSPVPTMGPDGQLYGPQHFQYGAPYYQQPTQPSAPYNSNQAPTAHGEVSTSVAPDQGPIPLEGSNGNSNAIPNGTANGNNGTGAPRPSYSSAMPNSNGSYARGILTGGVTPGYQDPRFAFDGARSPGPWLDGPIFPEGQSRPATSNSVSSALSHINSMSTQRNQNLRPLPHLMGLHHPRPASGMAPTPAFMNRIYPNNRMYHHGSSVRTNGGFGSSGYDSRSNGRGWVAVDNKYKTRGRGNGSLYGNENMDVLNEQNRGPRAARFKNQRGLQANITLAVKGQNLLSNANNEDVSTIPNKDQYNRPDFVTKYSDAKFFIIKSYSEDDIHKSIKYSVWASTPNGNKKLDAAYKEAQEKTGGCPVFLFFSVNASGQFLGVAEMVGPVDFNKNVEFWQQDKWNGCFPVKWHVVKDVPNNQLKHIILENNDNKPVTNSRDTQEVKFDQGIEILKIFKEYGFRSSMLDDFVYYDGRQKAIQEKRAKQQQLQKQAGEGGADDEEGQRPKQPKATDVTSKDSAPVLVDRKPAEENGVGNGDVPKGASKPSSTIEKKASDASANGC
ncbi:YTH domain-containing family protein 1 isoform X2 [Amborella trichopoda]|uniref:YTH domain-containing family protein 1 isoform X2 n=1 Tax=Amborella trichopoda TaxID=13333 RepID=UPI0009BDFA14|nr:YTH domain-containing family protein 1 isoform X2 [Amborella trichopoda]|eukprot:XP_020524783.1 YTH domain-containing family protein 1 isoform X2 [Amborella trichopoda]